MTILKLPDIVYPLAQVNKVNEIVDVLNEELNFYYSEYNPTLPSINGTCTWVVTHNLGSEALNCSVYQGDNLVLADVQITSENVVTIEINSSNTIQAETYTVMISAGGNVAGSGSQEDTSSTYIVLPNKSGSVNLDDNLIYGIEPTGTITFVLPTVTDATKFHQIMVQVKLASVQTINLGTTYYFNKVKPDLSSAGLYNIMYEYDNIDGRWVVGSVSKGVEE